MGDIGLCCIVNGIWSFLIDNANLQSMFLFMISLLIGSLIVINFYSAKQIFEFYLCDNSTYYAYLDFDYGFEKGPHRWKDMFPAARGCYQSPINIRTENTEILKISEPLIWRHYDDLPVRVTIQNTGHTVELRAQFQRDLPTLSGADLLENYTFISLCFRWSNNNQNGSEHSINNRKFSLELQATHMSKQSCQMQPSYSGDLGLLILGYFYMATHFDNPYLDPIVMNLHAIRKPMQIVEIPPFPLSWLVYPYKSGFYSYGGSLTQPPCSEGVTWFIHPEAMAISEDQLSKFRTLLSKDGTTEIMKNSRPVQNLNSRIVCYNRYSPCIKRYERTTAEDSDAGPGGDNNGECSSRDIRNNFNDFDTSSNFYDQHQTQEQIHFQDRAPCYARSQTQY